MFLRTETNLKGINDIVTVDKDLLKAVLSLDSLEDVSQFFSDMFTPAELEDLSLRWKLLKDLHQGVTQRKISEKYGISLCKITRGSKLLKSKDTVVLKLLENR